MNPKMCFQSELQSKARSIQAYDHEAMAPKFAVQSLRLSIGTYNE